MEQKTYMCYQNNKNIFKIFSNTENERRQIEFNEELQFKFDENYLNNIRK